MAEEKFEEDKFMKFLVNLKDTQESIQGFSGWCIRNRKSAYKMARCWIKVIKKVRVEQKLVLFYLVNDIVQHSSKRNYSELLEKFRNAIKEAIPHLKDEKIGPKVQRCLDIWEERDVFDKDFLQDLTALIDLTPVKEDQEIVENFQPPQLCTQIKILKALEDDADYKLKTLKENELDIQNINEMKLKLKDKHCGAEYVQEFEDGTKRMEQYIKAMEREIRKRRQVIELLGQGKKYYDSVFGEAEIVATAYSNFGNRVTKVRSKLSERMSELGNNSGDSPVPSPDYDAPSPAGSGDEMEIRLPDEGSSNNKPSSKSGSDLTTRLSEMNYDSFQTPSKDQFSISEVLTRMAQGEQVDVDGFISGDMKRRRLSGGGYDPSTGGMFDTPQPRVKDPWSESTPVKEPVPDLLSWKDDDQVENLALARLKQAASKNNKTNSDKSSNGVHSSNLVSLTGSPGVKNRKRSGHSGGGSRSDDMEVSDDDNSDIRDSFLEDSFNSSSGRGHVSPWESGHHQPPPPAPDLFSAPPPALFPHPPVPQQCLPPGYNGSHHDHHNPAAFQPTLRPPPPLMQPDQPEIRHPPPFPQPETRHPPPLLPHSESSDSGAGRGNFGPPPGFGGSNNPNTVPLGPRFARGGNRFPGPGARGGFSEKFGEKNGDSETGGRGGMRGGRGGGGFRGGPQGGFDRGRGRGGWNNGPRRPWGGIRGRGRGGGW